MFIPNQSFQYCSGQNICTYANYCSGTILLRGDQGYQSDQGCQGDQVSPGGLGGQGGVEVRVVRMVRGQSGWLVRELSLDDIN